MRYCFSHWKHTIHLLHKSSNNTAPQFPRGITSILPESYWQKSYTFSDINRIHLDMEDMQKQHEKIMYKTLQCYKHQMAEMARALKMAQHETTQLVLEDVG